MSITKLYALSPCTVKCVAGTAPGVVNATAQQKLFVDGRLVLTEMDTTATPMGTCNILTAAAAGVPTPCSPVLIPMTWQATSMPETINGQKIVLKTSMINCAVGGLVTVSG